MNNQKTTNHEKISRIEALKKIGNYGKYSALTAIGTYMLLNPKKAQAFSFINDPDAHSNDDGEDDYED
jgi:hypothetical protein|tara:strand:- start:147 stop:350 length:204 start_codon:yes stop_codon:yes gene_type:complete